MNNGFSRRMKERIAIAPDGSVFTASDFADIADTATIRQCLNRMVSEKALCRVIRGVFEKPRYSSLLNEYVAVDPDKVAQALARSYHWTITASGNTALNLLGLSEQVASSWEYLSDGPYKTYEWGNTKLVFKHRTNKEITGLSHVTSLVIQALKALGKGQVTAETIQYLSGKLSEEERTALMAESGESTDWIVDTIRKICTGGAA